MILNYYFSNPKFHPDILGALREFFDLSPSAPINEIKIRDEVESGLFNEWFVYDFKLSNGRTPLEDFYLTNPDNLNDARLEVYKQLQDNCYGFYKIKEVRLGEGLLLENIQTGKVYWVKEYQLTFCVTAGQVFPGRVAKVGEHYELVSTAPPLPPIKMSPEVERVFRGSKENWNPKVIWSNILSREGEAEVPREISTLKEAEVALQEVLFRFGLNKFVDTATIKEWIYNESVGEFPALLNLIFSLLPPDRMDYDVAVALILERLARFYRFCPQKKLGDKTPLEKVKESNEKGLLPDINLTISKNPIPPMYKKYHQVIESLSNEDFDTALKRINRFFCLPLGE